MKNILSSFLLIGYLLFLGCGKKINIPNDITQGSFAQFQISGIPNEKANMYAIITATKENGDTIFSNRKVNITREHGKYLTQSLSINAKELTVLKFLVFDSNDSIYVVSPKAGSRNEKLVPKALPIKFTIQENSSNQLHIPVTVVASSESAASYGYHQTEFGANSAITLSFYLSIKVGQIWYDSLPGLLYIKAITNDNQIWSREIHLSEGLTRINVPKGVKEYQLNIEKWGSVIQQQLTESTIHSGDIIHLTAEKNIRYLLSESVAIDNGTGYVLDSKKVFVYDDNNRIAKTLYYQRSAIQQGMPLVFQSNFRFHSGNRWDSILRYNASGELIGYLSRTFDNNKVIAAYERSYDYYTNADYSYQSLNDRNEIHANYRFSNGNTLQYRMLYKKDNNIQDKATNSTGSIESGNYLYDSNVNPFYHLDYDNIFLSAHSKNNIINSSKIYVGSFPSVVPYHYKYSYTDDGYPSEVVISYKGYTSQKHSYRIKKTYQYR